MTPLEFRCHFRYRSGFVLDAAFTAHTPVTALFGPSGSGKTTILSLIAGLKRPALGSIRVGDRTLFDSEKGIDRPPEARRIGYVFQDQLLFPHLTVRRNLEYGYRRRTPDACPVDFARAVEVLELGSLLGRWPHALSGGERQRVALGRALLSGPALLLLDEPLAGVDAALKGRVLDYVEQIVREWRIPSVYVTHDVGEVVRLAQEVVLVQNGKVLRTGIPEILVRQDSIRDGSRLQGPKVEDGA